MIAQSSSTDTVPPGSMAVRAWGLLILRILLVATVSFVMWQVLRATSNTASFPPPTLWATLGLFPINVVCFLLLRKLYREQGLSLRQAMGIEPGRIGKDIAWGLLWLMVLNVPFLLAVSGTVFVMYGPDAPAAFETIFVSPDALTPMNPVVLLAIGLLAVVPFMVLNAPVEELIFRGYGLTGLRQRVGRIGAMIATSVMFGVQHIFFAATVPGMIVYFVAFSVWGFTAAFIVTRQGRLFPVIIAHWIVNTLLSAPGLVLPLLLLTGVIEQP